MFIRRALFSLAALVLLVPAAMAEDSADRPVVYEERALGSADAPITVYEYASMTCGHCANFHTDVLPKLQEEFIDTGKVRLVFRDMPFDQLALQAAQISRCMPENAYFPFLKSVFKNLENWVSAENPVGKVAGYARLAGMTEGELNACMENAEVFQKIGEVREEGMTKYGIDGTPSFVIDGITHGGNRGYDYFADLFNSMLKED